MFDVLCRVQIKRRLRSAADLAQARAVLGKGALFAPPGAVYRGARVGGVAGEWVTAAHGAGPAPVLLYLHGGGYFTCSPRTHRPITASFAQAGFDVFVPDYRLAPEHPFPAAVDDAEAVWKALCLAHSAAGRPTVGGDSAGGGLALGLMTRLRDAGSLLPAAAALFSPWTDLASTGESMRGNARRDATLWAPGVPIAAAWYLDGADPLTPQASPLYARLAGLPPLSIDVGEREILLDDSRRLAARARAEGVAVTLNVWPVVPHVWQMAWAFLPEGRQSLHRAATFLHRHAAGHQAARSAPV
jgi:acetyl esterase/lipase